MDSQSLQQALRDLDSAYQHFFRRARNGEKKKGFPKFKSRKTDPPRFRIPQRVRLEGSVVSVPKIGLIKVILHRPLEGVTKGATFKREACGHWYSDRKLVCPLWVARFVLRRNSERAGGTFQFPTTIDSQIWYFCIVSMTVATFEFWYPSVA